MSFNVAKGDYTGKTDHLTAVKFPYIPHHFQYHAFDAIENGNHCITTAHTGSGKTSVGTYGIGVAIRENKKAVYTAPIKALSNQIYRDLRKDHPDWDVGLRTGDIEINADAQVVVMTTEILRNMVVNNDSKQMKDIMVVIFDEFHWMRDHSRGHVWGECIRYMPAEVQMIMLSATIPNAEEVAEKLARSKKHHVTLVPTEHRLVPLTHYIITNPDSPEMVQIMDNKGHFNSKKCKGALKDYVAGEYAFNRYLRYLNGRDKLPGLFFCFSRKDCEKYAKSVTMNLVDGKVSSQINTMFKRNISKLGHKFDGMPQVQQVQNLLVKGICFHHSGLHPILKEIVEMVYAAGLGKILFVTETFAAGINMSFRTVGLLGLSKYDGYLEDFRHLYTFEYIQMAGRAGRLGKDKEGVVIIMPVKDKDVPEEDNLKKIMTATHQGIDKDLKMDCKYVLQFIRKTPPHPEGDVETETGIEDAPIIIDLKESMLGFNGLDYIAELKAQLAKTLGAQKSDDPEWKPSDSVLDYFKLKSGHYKGNQFKKKNKEYTRHLDKLDPPEREKFMLDFKRYTNRCERLSEIEKLEVEIADQEAYLTTHISNICQFLYDNGFLNEYRENLCYTQHDLTVKGMIAAQTDQCNGILFAEMVVERYFDDLDTHELMAMLAMFIENKVTYRELQLPDRVFARMESINKLSRDYSYAEYNANIETPLEWDLHPEYTDIAYYWSKGTNLEDMYKRVKIEEGNFVKNILKLTKLCESLISACKLIDNLEIPKKLEEYETLLKRSIVTPDSLYVL